MTVDEGVELAPVRAVGLRIDVPDARSRGPLRTDEGVLAADEVDVRQPEQVVVVVLRGEGDRV
jgi:hypothetical protein